MALDKNAKIFVAGHHGLVGSAIWNNLKARGYENLVGKSHAELDLLDPAAVKAFFDEEQPEGVVLAAAFIGGALFGIFYIVCLRKGTDIAAWVGRIIDFVTGLFRRKPKMKVSYKRTGGGYNRPESDYDYNARKHNEQKEIDAILDKIAKSGYNGLTDEEKRILFRNSQNN